MVSSMVYDALNKKQRKEIRRGNIFCVVTVWVILMLLSIFAGICVYILAKEQGDRIMVTLSCFFHLTCISTCVALFLALLLIPIMGRQSLYVDFYSEHFSMRSTDSFENTVFEINYHDVEKIYVSKISKLHIWQKYVGHFQVYFQVKKEKRDGVLHHYPKTVYRQLPPVYSLTEANEIIEFFEIKKLYKKHV